MDLAASAAGMPSFGAESQDPKRIRRKAARHGFNQQLDRKKFFGRVEVESTIQLNICLMIHITLLMLTFIVCGYQYDPISDMAAVHANLRTLYNVDQVESAKTPDQVRAYMQSFVETTYEMASALVDANTMDSIDPWRCFDSSTNDVCRLKYWETPTRLKQRPNYVDIDAIEKDQVSPKNFNRSLMDCKFQPGDSPHDCINWNPTPRGQLNMNYTTNVMGLTGEDPIIMDSRRQYPFRSVVALAPIVWQSRAKIVPCSGFGNRYNEDLLNAGHCTVDEPCDPSKTTSFKGTKQNPFTNRKQSIFITYSEDAFFCIERAKEETMWYDKTWHPWATLEDLTTGVLRKAKRIGGKNVFWKFIPDTAYLMGPINGTIFFDQSNPCSGCTEWGASCTDPMEDGPQHPMWNENNMSYRCSMRREWIRRFLKAEQEHRFIDIQTSELTIAALVITPQGENYPDITTLVRVIFTVEQYGAYVARVSLSSVSETISGRWLGAVALVLTVAITLIMHTVYKYVFMNGQAGAFRMVLDTLCGASVLVYITINLILEGGVSPSAQLMASFIRNNQDDYVDSFAGILDFAENIYTLKLFGFFVVTALLVRIITLFEVHPRLGLVTAVLEQCADDIFHFCVQFALVYFSLAWLGFWIFGMEDPNFQSYPRACYTLLRFFIEVDLSEQPPSEFFIVYAILYIILVSIFLTNFLLAIVVEAFSVVAKRISENDAEKNVLADMFDSTVSATKQRLFSGWPFAFWMREYLLGTMKDMDTQEMPAVTADELYHNCMYNNGQHYFHSLDEVKAYLSFYAGKVDLSESRPTHLYMDGHYYGESEEEPLGCNHRQSTPAKPDRDQGPAWVGRSLSLALPVRRMVSTAVQTEVSNLALGIAEELSRAHCYSDDHMQASSSHLNNAASLTYGSTTPSIANWPSAPSTPQS
eukprot:TRINITY_DN9334_c0_g1_i2.p1 TRINITY_DN9334_c0_g1~~TRINITY_DN9334_c0_g1_i2.p1  ORF type:complete len:926 (-),score=102.71 TRINITY_DN9334_c0_g1_i2:220-2997(-)